MITTTMTVREFEALYDTPYDKENLVTDQLIPYDVIVFGFAENYPTISNRNGALDNVISYIERGKGVIFTSDVLGVKNDITDSATEKAYETLRSLAGMTRYDMDQAYALNNKEVTFSIRGYTYAMLHKTQSSGSIYSLYN